MDKEQEDKAKIRVYFDEEYDQKTYTLRIKKKEKGLFTGKEKGFYIEKEKYEWIQKTTREYEKAQQYISMKLIREDLI